MLKKDVKTKHFIKKWKILINLAKQKINNQ